MHERSAAPRLSSPVARAAAPRTVSVLCAEEVRHRVARAQGVPGGEHTPLGVLDRVGAIALNPQPRVGPAHRFTVLARLPRDAALPRIDAELWSRGEALSFELPAPATILLPIDAWPAVRGARADGSAGPAASPVAVRAAVMAFIARSPHGVTLARLDEEAGRSDTWERASGRRAAEELVARGRLTTSDRRGHQRVFDITERRVHPDILAPRGASESAEELAVRAARSLGVLTAGDLSRHYRIGASVASSALGRASAGPSAPLRRVRVAGWAAPAWVPAEGLPGAEGEPDAPASTVPEGADWAALTSRDEHAVRRAEREDPRLIGPFDPLLRDRRRVQRVFGFDYVFEAFKPSRERVYGRYVFGVFAGTRFHGRAELRLEGQRLLIRGAVAEAGTDPAHFEELTRTAGTTLAAQLGVQPEFP